MNRVKPSQFRHVQTIDQLNYIELQTEEKKKTISQLAKVLPKKGKCKSTVCKIDSKPTLH